MLDKAEVYILKLIDIKSGCLYSCHIESHLLSLLRHSLSPYSLPSKHFNCFSSFNCYLFLCVYCDFLVVSYFGNRYRYRSS